jgi:hypothetical protein
MTQAQTLPAAEHFTEDDWTRFARGEDPARRARVAEHLELGCTQCEHTLRVWSVLLSVAEQEALGPAEGQWRHRTVPVRETVGRRIAAGVALVFDSFRQPELAAVRATGPATRQLLYKAGRYTIKLQVEPGAASDRVCLVGQILDDQDPAAVLRDIAVSALKGARTLGRTHTNRMGEFHLEPGATEDLQLSVDVPEIGTFSVEPPRSTEAPGKGRSGRAAGASGRRKRARPR